jgi:hypothetical protein
LLQITITTPWRRITLQLSQRGFTDARTFTLRLLTYAETDETAPSEHAALPSTRP